MKSQFLAYVKGYILFFCEIILTIDLWVTASGSRRGRASPCPGCHFLGLTERWQSKPSCTDPCSQAKLCEDTYLGVQHSSLQEEPSQSNVMPEKVGREGERNYRPKKLLLKFIWLYPQRTSCKLATQIIVISKRFVVYYYLVLSMFIMSTSPRRWQFGCRKGKHQI